MPSGILIHRTAWPHRPTPTSQRGHTGQDGTYRQRFDSIGRAVLKTVAQELMKKVQFIHNVNGDVQTAKLAYQCAAD